MNKYEKDHPLQIKWREASKIMMCLCTMRESCSHCDYDGREKRQNKINDVIVEARNQGYQLWSEPQRFMNKDFPAKRIKMVRTTTSGYELD
jgi:hypothetical protein